MAGDWIKMRDNLWDDPRVAKIVDLTDSSEAAVVGALYWLWAMADQHTENGILPGLTLRSIDRKTGVPGFAGALCAIEWLADHPEGVRIIDFEKHNGSSAKKRCQTAKRVAHSRSGNDKVTQPALQKEDTSVSYALAREEKRREEKIENKKTVGSAKRRTQLAPDFYPNEIGVVAIEQTGLSKAVELTKFRNHHEAKGSVMADWQAAWRTWVSNGVKFAPSTRSSTTGVSQPESFKAGDDRVARSRWEEMTGRTHPDNLAKTTTHGGLVVDITPKNMEITQ